MKKYLLILAFISVMLFGHITKSYAQTYYYRTTEFAIKETNAYGTWKNWSAWEPSNLTLTIDLDRDIVRIYSRDTQVYRITKYVRNYVDDSGGNQLEFRFIDQDGDRGSMRLRQERNGNSQIYIEFSNVMWVYNVIRTN